MKILKFVKDKGNKYKVIIDDDEYVIHDDTIVKYSLLTKKEITKSELDEIISYNQEMDSFYLALKYISKKMRSEREIREYLKKKEVASAVIDKVIVALRKRNYIDDERYIRAYINDQVNLSKNGPLKIIKCLRDMGMSSELIDEYMSKIPDTVWQEKVEHIILNKIKTNHNTSAINLKKKIIIYLVGLGYDKQVCETILNKYDIIDDDIYKKEYSKAKRQLEKKYQGYQLEQKIKERLYRRGFYNKNYEED